MEHRRTDAEQALDQRAARQNSQAQALVDQAAIGVEESNRLEEERQAAYRYFLETGKDILDAAPPLEGGVDELPDDIETEGVTVNLDDDDPANSLQDRLQAALTLAAEEETALVSKWTRGGTTVIRWGIMQDDESEDYTLGVSVAYNDQEPADVYLAVTQQRLNEWASLQGKDGEKRFAMGLVAHLVNLTGEDIAVEIASALGELVHGPVEIHADPPTETAVGSGGYDDDALTDEDGS